MNNPLKTLELIIKFLATTPGRDKTCRFVQYSFKFLKTVFFFLAERREQASLKAISEKIGFISANMSLTRKVLRFGRPIGTLYNLYKLLNAFVKKVDEHEEPRKENSAVYVFFKASELIASTLYFLIDHVIWLVRVGLIKKQPWYSTIDFLCEFMWLLECIFGLAHNCVHIHTMQKAIFIKAQKLGTLKEREALEQNSEFTKQIDACIIDILRNLIDLPVCIGFLKPGFISEGYQGILGSISSYIGCYQNWPSA